jgi:hypothetical protein
MIDNNNIFVQIASYRDPELLPTLKDCINKAAYPNNLRFGICWQHAIDDEWDNLDEYENNPNFTIIDVNWTQSKGVCWARSNIQKLWKNEKYTLQLDSHHRFIKDWDIQLIEMMEQTGSIKPIISAYAGAYNPKDDTILNVEPYKLIADHFTPAGNIRIASKTIDNYKDLTAPIKARLMSGHFFFTLGIHCAEYKYDPNMYFDGEELSLALRSYTLGYDLYHPHKVLIWHEYTRIGRTKHWDDFTDKNKNDGLINNLWHDLDNSSLQRLRNLLQQEYNIDLNEYCLGTERTIEDYEKYAGVNFKLRKIHPDANKGVEPPVTYTNNNWLTDIEYEYSVSLSIPKTDENKFDFIFVGIESKNGELLYRKDLLKYEENVLATFKTKETPYKWIYWLFKNEWGEKKEFILTNQQIKSK